MKTAENWALSPPDIRFYVKSWGGVTVVRMTSIHRVASTRGQTFVCEVLQHVIPRKNAVVTVICDEIHVTVICEILKLCTVSGRVFICTVREF